MEKKMSFKKMTIVCFAVLFVVVGISEGAAQTVESRYGEETFTTSVANQPGISYLMEPC